MDTIQQLRQVPLFKTLNDDDLKLIEPSVKPVRYAIGALACSQGEIGTMLFIVESGEFEVLHVDTRGKHRNLDTKRAGDYFGEMALLLGEPYKTTFRAKTEAVLATISREDFTNLVNQNAGLRSRLIAGLSPEVRKEFEQYHFAWLMPGEVIIVLAHKHWWAFVEELPKPAGIIVAVFVIAILASVVNTNLLVTVVIWAIVLFIIGIALAFLAIDWRNDDYIVTNRRVMHLERVLLVREERQEASIDKVQNVQIRQPTLFQKIIGISDVLVTTAAVHGTIAFATVANGPAIRDKIFEQMQRAQAQRMFEAREKLKQEIRTEFDRATAPFVVQPPVPLRPQQMQPPRRSLREMLNQAFATRFERDGTITWRKHFIALFLQAWRPVLIFLGSLLAILLSLPGWLPLPPTLVLILGLVMLGMTFWFGWEFIDWSNDIYRLTKDRVIDLERNPLGVIQHSVEAPISAVQNVSYRQPNILFVFFGIGEVLIQTAGQSGDLIFFWMSPPSQVANEILQYVENARERQRQVQRSQQRADMLQWFGAYHGYLEDEELLQKRNAPSQGSSKPSSSTSNPGGSDSSPRPPA